jgi:hypothetical protein
MCDGDVMSGTIEAREEKSAQVKASCSLVSISHPAEEWVAACPVNQVLDHLCTFAQ